MGMGKRGRKSCREAWYSCTFKAVEAVQNIRYVHIPLGLFLGLFGMCMSYIDGSRAFVV